LRSEKADRALRARRRGRRAGVILFGALVVTPTALWTYQILTQVFGDSQGRSAEGCRAGLAGLLGALHRARAAAAAETGDERAALMRFRAALEPEWRGRATTESACRGDAPARAALSEVDALRYAEEHAVRYDAVGLAPQRRRVQALENALFGPKGGPAQRAPY
jgi:hypothetical protein